VPNPGTKGFPLPSGLKNILVSKKKIEISDDVKNELDIRIKNLGEGKTELYTWDEVKSHLRLSK